MSGNEIKNVWKASDERSFHYGAESVIVVALPVV